jgi:lipopolysaccharide export system protein LptA
MNKSFLLLPLILFVLSGFRFADGEDTLAEQFITPLTVVRSDSLEMTSTPERNYFYFSDNVTITGKNLLVKCDNLEVTASRSGEAEATIGRIGVIKKFVAIGSVVIYQAGRAALAGRAELLPAEDKIILTDSPRILDRKAVVSGWRITLLKGNRTAIVENNPDDSGENRPTVFLDALPNMGFDSDDNENADFEERESE